jgi:hypothetical protein
MKRSLVVFVAVIGFAFASCEVSPHYNILTGVTTVDEAYMWVVRNIEYAVVFRYRTQSPEETFASRRGDCDDKALLLMYILWEELGVDSELVAVEIEGARHDGHAFVRVGDRVYGAGPYKDNPVVGVWSREKALRQVETFSGLISL